MKTKHRVFIVFGEKNTVAENASSGSAISEYEFNTKVELDAFLQGVDAASGWMEYANFKTEKEAKEYVADVVGETEE